MTVDRIVLGLVPTDRLRVRDARTLLFTRALEDRLHFRVIERNVGTYDELEQAMTGGQIDLAWLPPLIFARLDQRAVATAVATVARAGDAYWSVLLTSRISGITALDLDQLRGRRIAWVDPLSASGHVVARLGLAALGGRVDVAATFARCDDQGRVVHGPWVEAGVAAEDVVLLALLGEVPPDLIAACSRLPQEVRDAIRIAMVDISRDATMAPSLQAIFGGTRFVAGAPASYAALCSLLDQSSGTLEAFASTNPPDTMRK